MRWGRRWCLWRATVRNLDKKQRLRTEKGTWFRHVVTRNQERGALFGYRALHSIDEWDMSHGRTHLDRYSSSIRTIVRLPQCPLHMRFRFVAIFPSHPPVSPVMAVRYALKKSATYLYHKRIPYKFAHLVLSWIPSRCTVTFWRSFPALASDSASYKRFAFLRLFPPQYCIHVYRYSPIHASQRKTANN